MSENGEDGEDGEGGEGVPKANDQHEMIEFHKVERTAIAGGAARVGRQSWFGNVFQKSEQMQKLGKENIIKNGAVIIE